MKKNNKGYSYRPNQRRKRIRINKIRFTIFVLSYLTILFGIGFGIKALLTDKVEVNIGLTDDLNPVEGESMYKLSLTWESLAADKYKDIQITVNDKKYVLESDSNKFEVELTEPNEAYEVTFKAKKKG